MANVLKLLVSGDAPHGPAGNIFVEGAGSVEQACRVGHFGRVRRVTTGWDGLVGRRRTVEHVPGAESVAPWRSRRPLPRAAAPWRSRRPLWRPPAAPPRKAARPTAVHAARPTAICTGPTTSACGRGRRGPGKAAGVRRGRSPRPGPPPSRGHSFGAGSWIDMRGPRLVKTKLVETKKTTRKEGERSRLCFGGDYQSPSTGENGKPLRESPLFD